MGQLYEEGRRNERSSDSGRRSHSRFTSSAFSPASVAGRSGRTNYTAAAASSAGGGGFNTSLMTNIQKLFSEKVDVFNVVEFNKVSIMTGIVKICLKVVYVISWRHILSHVLSDKVRFRRKFREPEANKEFTFINYSVVLKRGGLANFWRTVRGGV